MIIQDKEFGEVQVRKNAWSTGVRFSVAPSGRLTLSVPHHTSEFLARRLLNQCRTQIKTQLPIKDPTTQRARDAEKRLLKKKAKEYLPYRLEFLAKKHGYHYDRHRLSHASTRWGSCSTTGTISLNIALMKLPAPLRDYVILHELTHTHHMDHSKNFYAELATLDPNYKRHQKALKLYSPSL